MNIAVQSMYYCFLLSVLMVSGCNHNSEKTEQGDVLVKQKTVVFIVSTLNNPFFISMKEGIELKANQKGYSLLVLNSLNNSEQEVKNMKAGLTAKGGSAIILNPTDSDAAGKAVKLANRASIPVITIDRDINRADVKAHVASDNVSGGEIAANYIVKRLGGEGSVIQLEGIPDTSTTRNRGKGFLSVIKESGVELLTSQTGWFDRARAMNVTENLLQIYPEVKAIFAQNDEMALGATKAVEVAKKDIIIIGFDGTEEGIEAVSKGVLSATIAQQARIMGEKGMELADEIIRGEPVEALNPVSLRLITKP